MRRSSMVSTQAETLTVWLPNCLSVLWRMETSDAKARTGENSSSFTISSW